MLEQLSISRRETEHTADISALKRSVPREQGSRIRHSRPKDSAAPASRLHTAMSEVVGSERSEGKLQGHRMFPWHTHAAVVSSPGCFLPCMQLSHSTLRWPSYAYIHSVSPRTSWIDDWLVDCGVSILSATDGAVPFLLPRKREQTVRITVCDSCTPCQNKSSGGWVVSLMVPLLGFEAGLETPCGLLVSLDLGGLLSWELLNNLERCARLR